MGVKEGNEIKVYSNKKYLILILFLGLFLVLNISTASAADNFTIYVNDTGGNDSWDGQWAQWHEGTLYGPKKSIKNATDAVNPDGQIFIADGHYTGENNNNIVINKNLTLVGQSKTGTIINGSGTTRIFTIPSGFAVNIYNLTLTQGKAIDGGAVYNEGLCVVVDSCVSNCVVDGNGGGIYNVGSLFVSNCSFVGNFAIAAGVIYNLGNLTVVGGVFSNNSAYNWGAVCNRGNLTAIDCSFLSNVGYSSGASICNLGNTGVGVVCVVSNCLFKGNTADWGGAIYNDGFSGRVDCVITNCVFTNNIARYGGAIYSLCNNASVVMNCTVDNCTFAKNSATFDGGAIYLRSYDGNGFCTVINSNFMDCYADMSGGAIGNILFSLVANFNRFYNNTVYGGVETIYNNLGTVDIQNNWWGTNNPEWGSLLSGITTPQKWIILSINNTSVEIEPDDTLIISINLNYNNLGENLLETYGKSIPNVDVVLNTTLGRLSPYEGVISGGQNITVTFNSSTGVADVKITVDKEINEIIIRVFWDDAYVATAADGGNDSNNGSSTSPFLSLNKAIDTLRSGGRIHIAHGLYGGLDNINLIINKNMTIMYDSWISGTGNNVTIDAEQIDKIFNIIPNVNFKLQNMILINGKDTDGGAIYNQGNLTINNCIFTNNTANQGGAVYNEGLCVFVGSCVSSCVVDGRGGGIFNVGSLFVSNCSFVGNSALAGSVIDNLGNLTVVGGVFSNNVAYNWGSICNMGNLTTINCSFMGNLGYNSGAGISNLVDDGVGVVCVVTNCLFSGNNAYWGGAIYTYGSSGRVDCVITNCIFISNTANQGGAIYTYCRDAAFVMNCTVDNCTFTKNSATNDGGAIFQRCFDGNGFCTVTNSNFVDCTSDAFGGAINNMGFFLVANFNRFYNNTAYSGGAVYNNNLGTVDIQNNWWGTNNPDWGSLLSGITTPQKWIILSINVAPNEVGVDETSSVTVNLNYNNLGENLLETYGKSIPDVDVVLNATLGTLNPYGGVVSGGQNLTVIFAAEDMPGIAILNATVDKETQEKTVHIVRDDIYVATDGNDTTGTGSQSNPFQSLAKALAEVQAIGTIHIANGTYSGANNRKLTINKDMTMLFDSWRGAGTAIIDAEHLDRIFNIAGGVKFTLQNLTLINGNATDAGGAVYNGGNLTVENCIFTGNTANFNGGAIYNEGNLTVENCIFTGNTANSDGGAIYNWGGTLNIISSNFAGNTAANAAGTIFNGGVLVITNSTLNNNTATNYGGAIYNTGFYSTATSNITGSTFTGNNATYGGAIYNYGCAMPFFIGYGNVNVTESTFTGNNATYGGAICNANDYGTAIATVNFCRIVGNTASQGSAIYNRDGTVDADNNWWGTNNQTSISGLVFGSVNYSPWIVLSINNTNNPILVDEKSTIWANLRYNYDGTTYVDTMAVYGNTVPDVNVSFNATLGNLSLLNSTISNGLNATTVFTGTTSGNAIVNATVDNQTSNLTIYVINVGVLNEDTLKTFSTIQAAIDDSETLNGQRILVAGNTYTENVIVNKRLLIHSFRNVIIQALNSNNPVFTITSTGNASTIQGFIIKGSSNSGIYMDSSNENNILNNTIDGDLGSSKSIWGLCLVNSNQNNITNNTVIHCEEGINLYNSHNNIITNNTARDSHWDNIALNVSTLNLITGNNITNADSGIRLIGGSNNNTISNNNLNGNIWTSISLVNSIYNQITSNNLSNCQEGIYLYASNNNTISGNIANNNIWDGIAIHDSNYNIVTEHTNITGNNCGVRIIGTSTGNVVINNTINSNLWSNISLDIVTANKIYNNILNNANVGIYLNAALNNHIYNNTIQNNAENGINILYGSNNNIIHNNTISGSYYGERILDSNSNTSYGNNFINNTVQAYDNSTNSWDNGTTGNYWSDWSNTSPRPIAGGSNVDNHPSTTPF